MADDDDGWGDAWGEEPVAVPLDKKKFDYDKLDLNKLSDFELNRHKQSMDQDYQKNFLKKGDTGFEYDKRIEFKPTANAAADWDDEDEGSDLYESD